METSYDFTKIEPKWFEYWMKQKLFKPRETGKPTYTIVIPPPNVTGILHMGHVLNNTLQDILIRYKRMQQYMTLWVPGTDHAGIATQNKVEQMLARNNLSKEDLGREAFVKKVWEWKEKHGGIIIQQLKRLGCSCDWDRERFTMDPGLSRAVREVFVHLYRKGLIYKGKYIVNQCPRCKTALSDEEVEHRDTQGHLWYIRYPGEDGSEGIVVATTRPETMLGDVAVAVHPDDDRYKNYIGHNVILPLQNRPIPVIADEMVDREFGTGAVKITPAHDANDFEAGQRHKLEPILVMTETGIMTDAAGKNYTGLDRFECRKKVVEDLKKEGYLVSIENYNNAVGYCYRCGSVVEPYLSEQWFVRMKPLAEPAIEAVLKGDIVFYPERWKKVYLHWMENIRDWCISRQLWWGHRIPVWYCSQCGFTDAFKTDPETCPRCGTANLIQDKDVLDTWFSSWLWPFSTLGWPENTPDLQRFYPTQTLITAPEIIFFWVARMIMAGLEFMGEIPFSKVYLHGTVRDKIGRKMSKSLGNSPDPLDIMDKVGADALRLGMIMISPRGSDIFFSEDTLTVGKNFLNKVWNAARLIKNNCLDIDPESPFPEIKELNLSQKWLLYRLAQTTRDVSDHLDEFRFNDAAVAVYRFIWHEFCDWYLEIAKPALYGQMSDEEKNRTQIVLMKTMLAALKLLHPFQPFITEEIFHQLSPKSGSIMTSAWPVLNEFTSLKKDAEYQEILHRTITALRTIRAEVRIPPSVKIHALFSTSDTTIINLLKKSETLIKFLGKIEKLDIGPNVKPPELRATMVSPDGIDIYLDLEGIVDIPLEKTRLKKEISKAEMELEKVNRKLSNENFLSKAPPEIVEKNKMIASELEEKREKLIQALSRFE